jgi:Spy/CpxP family protein refolding chaperone
MKFKIIPILFYLISISIATPSFSQPSRMGNTTPMGMMHFKRETRCSKALELNLSQEQLKKLKLIQQNYFLETQTLRTKLFTKRLEIRELLTNPTINVDSIRPRYLEIAEIQYKLEEKFMEYLINVRNILTEEQVKKWCPEKEFPFHQIIPHGRMPIGPIRPLTPEE